VDVKSEGVLSFVEYDVYRRPDGVPPLRIGRMMSPVEMLNYKINAQGGITPAALSPPIAITLPELIPHLRKAQGRYAGDRHCPLLHRTSILFFVSW
jgi:hypothetical protein